MAIKRKALIQNRLIRRGALSAAVIGRTAGTCVRYLFS